MEGKAIQHKRQMLCRIDFASYKFQQPRISKTRQAKNSKNALMLCA
jgi:hypothetical protein